MLNKLITQLNNTYQEREIIFAASFGSHNYGTNDETSDYDYKLFVMPNRNDLYDGKQLSDKVKIDGNDIEVHDIRKFSELMAKANPTYIEMLNPKEKYVNEKYKAFGEWLFDRTNARRLSASNLEAFVKSARGMAKEKLSAIEKDLPNEETNEGYKRRMLFGFDTKQLVHIYRLKHITHHLDTEEHRLDYKVNITPYDLVKLPQDFANLLIDIKRNKFELNKEEAIKNAKSCIEMFPKEFTGKVDGEILDELRKRIKTLVLENI